MDRDHVLITVHGTFASDAAWARAESALSRSILQWFAARGRVAAVISFQWSGRNTVHARQTAGADLAGYLRKVHQESPQAALYVIAHSHGGSVVAFALKRDPEIADWIDGFVALATPWVAVSPASYAAPLRDMLNRMVLFMASAVGLIVSASTVGLWMLFFLDMDAGYDKPFLTSLAAGYDKYFLRMMLISTIGGLVIFYPAQHYLSRRLKATRLSFQHHLERATAESSIMNERLPPAVFLKPTRDEAALALTWTSAMAAVMQGASSLLFSCLQSVRDRWRLLPMALQSIVGVLLIVGWSVGTTNLFIQIIQIVFTEPFSFGNAIVNGISWYEYTGQADFVRWAASAAVVLAVVVWVIMLSLLLAFCLVLMVVFLAAVGAGFSSLEIALYCLVTVEAVPLGSHRLLVIDVSSTAADTSTEPHRGLRHSAMYDHPSAIRAVVDAIAQFANADRDDRGRKTNLSGGVDLVT